MEIGLARERDQKAREMGNWLSFHDRERPGLENLKRKKIVKKLSSNDYKAFRIKGV